MGLRLKNSSGNYVELNAPSSIATDFGLTLPVNDGNASQYLQTDGAGTLSWVTPTAGLTWNTLASDVSVGTSGAKTISGIDSNAKKVIMTWKNVSLSTGDYIYHMVGSGALNGSYQTAGGYFGVSNASNASVLSGTSGYFKFEGLNGSSNSFHGIAEYTYHGDNEWYCVSHQNYNLAYLGVSIGKVDLSGTLDRIALGGLGSSVFDAGTLSVFELV